LRITSWFLVTPVPVRRRRPDGHRPQLGRAAVVRASTSSAIVGLLFLALFGGCATLDARPEMERSKAAIEHALGLPANVLLLDAEAAKAKTCELLEEGLTANEAVQLSLLNNPRARSAMLSVGVSRAEFVQSTLFTNPTLALSFRSPDGGGLANFEMGLSQNIAELWLIPSRKEVAQRQLDSTVLQAAATIATIAYDARRAYAATAKAREEEAIAREAFGLAEQLHEVARLRREAGSGSEIDVNLARTKQLELQTALRVARLATIEGYTDLFRVLGIADGPETLQLAESLPEPSEWNVSPDALQQIARENRLDLKIAEQTVGEALARVEEERARFLKSLEVGLALERAERRSDGGRNWAQETFSDSPQPGQLTPPNLMPQPDQGDDVIIGPTFGIELPLWDQNQAQIRKAELHAQQALQLRDALLIDAAQDIHSRLARARTAAENALFYRDELLPAAERNVALARESYKSGHASFVSVLEAERSYLAARGGSVDALASAAVATIELEQVTGRPASALLQSESTDSTAGPSRPEVQP